MDSVVRETGKKVKDGLERVFVNTEIKDGTELSELMTCFLEKEVDNPNFPEFSKRMKFLKHEKGGLDNSPLYKLSNRESIPEKQTNKSPARTKYSVTHVHAAPN